VLVADLFPPCQDANCPLKGQHKHPLPAQLELIESPAKYIYWQSGYGASKTLGGCAVGILLSMSIPRNRGVVVRESYPKLHDSTQRVFMEALDRAKIPWKGRENRDGWYHRLIFPNESEVFFREGRNLGRFLGPEYGWFLIDEALEVEKEAFKKLQGRLRLAAARGYHKGILLSNPPHQNHWLHEVFGEDPRSWQVDVDMSGGVTESTTYCFMKSSTRSNPHNPPGYLSDLLTGLTQHEIARLVEGDYGYIPDGPPVYPTFEHARHVGEPELQPYVPVMRGWDFGFRHPAVTYHQFWRCLKKEIHWHWLAEIDGRMIEARPMADKVLPYTKALFPLLDTIMVEDVGDRSGVQTRDAGPGPIIGLADPPYNLRFMYQVCEIEPGLRMIRDFLRLPPCKCGKSRFLIHRRCRYSIEAFQGGYHLRRDQAGKVSKEEPMKDGFYDDWMDSGRYAAETGLRPELLSDGTPTRDDTDPRHMYKGRPHGGTRTGLTEWPTDRPNTTRTQRGDAFEETMRRMMERDHASD
jgi:terminase large subunit-like protein